MKKFKSKWKVLTKEDLYNSRKEIQVFGQNSIIHPQTQFTIVLYSEFKSSNNFLHGKLFKKG